MSRRLLSCASSVVLSSAVAALVAAVPTAWRLTSRGTSFVAAETALAAVLFLPLAAVVLLVEPLRPRWSERTSAVSGARGLALLLATFLFLGPSFVVAKVLVTHTHHRGLGGVTFAVATLGVAAVAIVIAWRAARFASSTVSPQLRRLVAAINRAAWSGLGFLGMGAGAALLAIAARPGGAAADASFVTLVATVAIATRLFSAESSESTSKDAHSWISPKAGTWVSAIAAGVLGIVVLIGAINLGTISNLRTSFQADAPLAAAVLEACGLGGTPAGPADPAER